MDNEKKVKRFNYYEKLLFKITLGVLGTSVAVFILFLFAVGSIPEITKVIINFTVSLLVYSGANFFLAIIRIIKYLTRISKLENNIGIMRSVLTLILSPAAFIILYILIIIMAFSSCSIQ